MSLEPNSSQWIYLCKCNELLLGSLSLKKHFKDYPEHFDLELKKDSEVLRK